MAKTLLALICVLVLCGLSACNRNDAQEKQTLAYWAQSDDLCVSKTAKAIIRSGRPWPNEAWGIRNGQSVLLKTDVWFGDQRYEVTDESRFLWPNDFLPKSHPFYAAGINGSVEDVLKIPVQHFEDEHVGGTLYGQILCAEQPWGVPWFVRVSEGRENPAQLIASLAQEARTRNPSRKIEIVRDERARMTAITVLRGAGKSVYAYVPDEQDSLVAEGRHGRFIWCLGDGAYDPKASLDLSAQCETWLRVSPEIYIKISVYQQYLPFLPRLQQRMVKIMTNARRD